MPTHQPQLRLLPRAALLTVAALVALLVFAACGGGGGGEEEEPTATAELAETPTAEPGGVTGDTVQVDKDFWHAGFKVTLGEAVLGADSAGSASVTIDATFENLGSQTATFNSQLALTSGGESYTVDDFNEDFPQVPGGLSGSGTLAFIVDDVFSFDDAVLTVGNPDNNQATVPLGAEGEYVSLEPTMIELTGTAVAGPVTLTVTGAELRADLPDWHQEMEQGKLAMTVFFSATVGNGIPIGQGVLQDQNVVLKLPDGTAVAVRSDGRSGVNELLQGKEGTTIPDLSARFEVPAPGSGQYAFVVRGQYVTIGTTTEGEAPFEVP